MKTNSKLKINTSLVLLLCMSATLIEELARSVCLGLNISVPFFVAELDLLFYIASYIFIFLIEIKRPSHKSLVSSIFVSLFIVLLFLITNIINPNVTIFNLQFVSLIYRIPLFVYLGNELYSIDNIFETLSKIVHISCLYALINLFWVHQTDYYMVFSYYLLPWAGIAYFQWSRKKRIVYLVETLFLGVVVFVFGARMPLLCLMIMVVFDNLFIVKERNKRALLLMTLLSIVTLVFLVFRNEMETVLSNLFPESRTILKFLSGDFFNTNQRIRIYEALISEIKVNPFAIRGLYSDRLFFGINYTNSNSLGIWLDSSNQYSVYAHNFVLEGVFDFGLIFGSLLILFIILRTVHAYKYSRKLDYYDNSQNRYHMQLVLFITIIGVFPLLVSNSYLSYIYFWLFIGMIIKKSRFKRQAPIIKETREIKMYDKEN